MASTSSVTPSATEISTPPSLTTSSPTHAVIDTPIDAQKITTLPLPSPFIGKFDLYSTQHPSLQSEYSAEGVDTPDFQAVLNAILFLQKKSDFTLQCALRADSVGVSTGRLRCSTVVNPFTEETLESIYITKGLTKDSVTFDAAESVHLSTIGEGVGFEAWIYLDTRGPECAGGMITSGSGVIKVRKVWEEQPGARELFEGSWHLNVVYGESIRQLGLGSSHSYGFPFWAVRALKKQGEEIGIDPGIADLVPSSSSHGLPMHLPGVSGLQGAFSGLRGALSDFPLDPALATVEDDMKILDWLPGSMKEDLGGDGFQAMLGKLNAGKLDDADTLPDEALRKLDRDFQADMAAIGGGDFNTMEAKNFEDAIFVAKAGKLYGGDILARLDKLDDNALDVFLASLRTASDEDGIRRVLHEQLAED